MFSHFWRYFWIYLHETTIQVVPKWIFKNAEQEARVGLCFIFEYQCQPIRLVFVLLGAQVTKYALVFPQQYECQTHNYYVVCSQRGTYTAWKSTKWMPTRLETKFQLVLGAYLYDKSDWHSRINIYGYITYFMFLDYLQQWGWFVFACMRWDSVLWMLQLCR